MSASHYNAAPLLSAATGSMNVQGGLRYGERALQAEPCWLVRYELAFLAFFGFFNVCECRFTYTHQTDNQPGARKGALSIPAMCI